MANSDSGRRRINPPFRADHVGSLIRRRRCSIAPRGGGGQGCRRQGCTRSRTKRSATSWRYRSASGCKRSPMASSGETTGATVFSSASTAIAPTGCRARSRFTEYSGEVRRGHAGALCRGQAQAARNHHRRGFRLRRQADEAHAPRRRFRRRRSITSSPATTDWRNRPMPAIARPISPISPRSTATRSPISPPLGCKYLQVDEVPLAVLCDPKNQETVARARRGAAGLIDDYIDLINAAIRGRPKDMTMCVHLCRGNFGHGQASGGYDPVAERLFQKLDFDGFFLEYDTARAGDFQPLRLSRRTRPWCSA